MNLSMAEVGKEYTVKDIATGDSELESFLFSLGCYSGEPITLVARHGSTFVVAIKDARYTIDKDLASAIVVQ
ncbi:MAG: ferrous iron transport protein A [Clostridiales bacterium]|nr:ferrous iron transport protein A [Clostridiales bacterium]